MAAPRTPGTDRTSDALDDPQQVVEAGGPDAHAERPRPRRRLTQVVAHRTQRLVERPYGVVASTALGVVVLAMIGAVLGPAWDPAPMSDPLLSTSPSTAITGAPRLGDYEVRQRVVEVPLDGATVQAQITEPVGAGRSLPAVVFVHGAGTGKFSRAFVAQARSFASHGIVTIVPDKRLDTYTTSHRDYVAMAADYERSVELARTLPAVDPDRVGIYAESEGGWIAPVMAAEDQRLAFVVLVSAPVVPPREQAAFAVDSYLRNTGVPRGVFRAIPRAVGALPGGGFEYADFDVTPYQRRMRQPVLVVYGTGDSSMPTVQGAEQVLRDTAVAGGAGTTVRYYEGANHGIRVHGDVLPEFLRDVSGWVLGLPGTAGAEPVIAGAQPHQTYLAQPVPMPRWLSDGVVMILGIVVASGLVVVAGLAVAVGRLGELLRRRRSAATTPARRFAPGTALGLAGLGAGSILTVVALAWYLVSIGRLALDYQRNDVIVTGGWLLVRAVGIAVVVVGVLLVQRVRSVHLDGGVVAPGVLRSVAMWTVVVCSSLLLVVLAYWGVYQLGI
ncbi:alpha/beta hydrolase family protein [Cellulomonas massiliensis]|uniref:alpha/beta hydrolase family protein n=1 Tax=Cellulomonas massiliensis TaxID=1465811 RepID=UPI0002FDD164|nr:alpha/beta hydrolase [Cellulomonas massiliensis]